MSAEGGIGAFLQGLSSGASIMQKQQQTDKLNTLLQQQGSSAAVTPSPSATLDSSGGGSAASSGGKAVLSSDPVATDMAPYQRAFLNAISDGESGGKYNVRYTPSGGATFDDLSQHPGIMEPTADGKKSSAAGRYQFTKTTWDGMGGGDFSPANQDRRAYQLAQSDYHARTGRDLDADLQSGGLTPQIMKALQPTWTSFGANQDRHLDAYNQSLVKYGQTARPAEGSDSPQQPAVKSITSASSDNKGGRTAMQIMGDLYPISRSIQQGS